MDIHFLKVDDAAETKTVLKMIGLVEMQGLTRKRYNMENGIRLAIDYFEGIPPILEIEAKNWMK